MTKKHLLVIRFSAVGDAAIAVPVIRAAMQQHPELKISVVTQSFLKPVFETVEGVEVLAADIRGKHKGVPGLYRFYKEIKDRKFDGIADLHGSLRSRIIKFFFRWSGVGAKTIDKGRAEKKALVKGRLFKQLKSSTERYADVFRALGVSVNLQEDVFPEVQPIGASLQTTLGLHDHSKKWIGIAPFAHYQTKTYPMDLMEEVLKALSASKQYQLILFGGGKELEELKRLSSTYKHSVYSFGKISFKEELQLISNLDLMVSMDSGNAHLAAMQGVKVLSLWGVTHPYAGFYPYKQASENCLLADREQYPLIPCSIYGNKAPESYKDVMRSIPAAAVVEKIKSLV